MARRRPQDFLDRLVQAGMRVFARKGLKRARMSDVAREMGVSHGTLYNYVQSKEALFYLLVDRGGKAAGGPLPRQWPLRTPSRRAILRRLEEQIRDTFALPKLDAALRRRRVRDARKELEEILRELYERTEETRGGATVIERSALDLPDLFRVFFVQTRRGLLARLTGYLERRIRSGHFRRVPDPAVAARVLLETVTTFGRHRHQDPDPQPMDDRAARETTVEMLVHSLIRS